MTADIPIECPLFHQMLPLCPDKKLESLSAIIQQCKVGVFDMGNEQRSLFLTIQNLKQFMSSDGRKLIKWSYGVLRMRLPSDDFDMRNDSISDALIDLITACIGFHEAIDESIVDTLFDLGRESAVKEKQMLQLLYLVGERLPCPIAPRLHDYLILGFSNYGNPYLTEAAASQMTDEQRGLSVLAEVLFHHMLEKQKSLTTQSLLDLLDEYLSHVVSTDKNAMDEDQAYSERSRYTLSYFLSVPCFVPELMNECWSDIFGRLYKVIGDVFLFEKTREFSMARISHDTIESVANLFPLWRNKVAFDRNGLIMKHALDLAIMLDTMVFDPRLDLEHHFFSSRVSSILEALRPSFETLDLEQASISLVDWAVSVLASKDAPKRTIESLKIPLFLLELLSLNSMKDDAVDVFVSLITRLDRPEDTSQSDECARYFVLKLVAAVEEKWPGVFQTVLEKIFSRAIAMHIADSEGSVNVEKILGNLAMLFEGDLQDLDHGPFDAFQKYITQRWQHVLLLFVSHPSMECRALGYRVLAISRFWELDGSEPKTISRLLMDSWFRHLKGRYLSFGEQEEISVTNELQNLLEQCCRHEKLALTMLPAAIDAIMDGALEKFPKEDLGVLQRSKMTMIDKARQGMGAQKAQTSSQAHAKSPPRYVPTMMAFLQNDLEIKDKVYMDNIERTCNFFYDLPGISAHISHKLQPKSIPCDTYDDSLPRDLCHACDIHIGNAFKDHPALFVIAEKCSTGLPVNDILRSVLAYFIAFWHMEEVAKVLSTLTFATQLEETARVVLQMRHILPKALVDTHRLFAYLSGKDLGELLQKVIWAYIREQPSTAVIPGLGQTDPIEKDPQAETEIVSSCLKNLAAIYTRRLKVLETAPSWHASLQQVGQELNI